MRKNGDIVTMGFHDRLLDEALAIDGLSVDGSLNVDNILSGRTYYRKTSFEEPLSDLSYYLTILDSGASGFAYHNDSPAQDEIVKKLIDKNALGVLDTEKDLDFPLRVSLLDAVYGECNKLRGRTPSQTSIKDGSYQEAADFRAQLVTERLLPGRRVLLVGLVTEFVRDMISKDIEVVISDMSPELTGKEAHGVPITNEGNSWTLKQIAECDAAVVTGSAFSTNTIDSILSTAQAYGTDLHFYLETGGNFAPFLIEQGAKSVVAEKFPFYDLPGSTKFEVYDR